MAERALRVVLTSESFLPWLSGVTVSVDALARGLGARGHRVMVVAPRPADGEEVQPVGSPGPEPEYAWLSSYQVPRLVPDGYRMAWPNPAGAAWTAARAFEPDVVHAHSPFVTGLLARRLARRLRAPLVFTHHTRFADYGHYLGPLARPGTALTDAYLRRFWAGCAAIVAPSRDLAADIRARLPADMADRVHVIPTGIDVEGIRHAQPMDPRAEAGWPPDVPVIATLGRLAPEKSPEVVLEAVARLADMEPAPCVLVVGGGPSEAGLRERAHRPDLAGRVELTGQLPRGEAIARVAGADLFAFASLTETQGLVLVEALAAGLPAVALDGPGVRDSIRDGIDGLIVPADPPESRVERLAAALRSLLEHPDRRRTMAGRAAGDADRFALGSRVAEVEGLYRSLLG